ncbi:acetyl-CoA carboxylase biotin carboxylase subunit family protein [Streptomyces sp. NPDC059708]|uniref:ATP-grasp domain-containing protein n=1 Tax=Streptomyces sp. NPDC059708 TaxID=3346916 RepID=UPI0036AE3410
MRFLVLNRTPVAQYRYPEFLGEAHDVVLITDAAAVPADADERAAVLRGYAHVEVVEEFHANPAVELMALRLHEKWAFERLLALSESDLSRGARLRAAMGVPGHSAAGVDTFRDKYAMKSALWEAGVPLLPFAAVRHATDLADFIAGHGYPVVVKPRRGGGPEGVEVLHAPDDLPAFLGRHPEAGTDDGALLLAETHLEHEAFHVDGVLVDGEIRLVWPSAAAGGTPVEPQDPLSDELCALAVAALRALPAPRDCVFHAEVFRGRDGTLVLNGISAGARDDAGSGLRLAELHLRSLTGNSPAPVSARPRRTAGPALLPARPYR